MKVLPKGFSDFKGMLLGFPVLDAVPFGLGLRTTEATHHFAALDAHTPRLELTRRKARTREMQSWLATGDHVRGWQAIL